MEVSRETINVDLRSKMQNHVKMSKQYASVMRENVTIRMATLTSQLSLGIFNSIRGKTIDVNILNELSQLLYTQNTDDIEQASVVLAFTNVAILAEAFLRPREREAETCEQWGNAPDYDDDQYSIERNSHRYFIKSPQKPMYEVKEEMDSIVQKLRNSKPGRLFSLENSNKMEHEDSHTFEKENVDWLEIMEDGQRMKENEWGQKESGQTTNITAVYNGWMKMDKKRTEKKDSSIATKEKEKVVGRRGQMVDKAMSLNYKNSWKKKMMNSPLLKTASAFGLKSNILECPFCEETFCVGGALDEHFRITHSVERELKLFGCEKCDTWYKLPSNAMAHHRQKGCKMTIRSVEEAKKWIALGQMKNTSRRKRVCGATEENKSVGKMDSDYMEANEASTSLATILAFTEKNTVPAPAIDHDMVSKLRVMSSESIHARPISSHKQSTCDQVYQE